MYKFRISTFALLPLFAFFSCEESITPKEEVTTTTNQPAPPPGPYIPWKCNIATIHDNRSHLYYSWGDQLIPSLNDPTSSHIYDDKIQYNSNGDPVRWKSYAVPFDSAITTFSYNRAKDLIQIVRRGYDNFTDEQDYVDTWDLSYQSGSITIQKTTVVGNTPAAQGSRIRLYFDTQGRLKEKRYFLLQTDAVEHHIMKYAYNAAGNLTTVLYIVPNEGHKTLNQFFSYDTKKNNFSTSKVWQLISEQYSVNNPTLYITNHAYSQSRYRHSVAYTYNLQNYPVNIDVSKQRYHFDTGEWGPYTGPVDWRVSYSCSIAL